MVSVQHKTLKLSSKHNGIIHRSSRASHRFQKVTARKTTQLEEYRPVKIFKFVVSNFINPGMVRWEPNRSWVFKVGERFSYTALDYPIDALAPYRWYRVFKIGCVSSIHHRGTKIMRISHSPSLPHFFTSYQNRFLRHNRGPPDTLKKHNV